jgi:hypothetical protein
MVSRIVLYPCHSLLSDPHSHKIISRPLMLLKISIYSVFANQQCARISISFISSTKDICFCNCSGLAIPRGHNTSNCFRAAGFIAGRVTFAFIIPLSRSIIPNWIYVTRDIANQLVAILFRDCSVIICFEACNFRERVRMKVLSQM